MLEEQKARLILGLSNGPLTRDELETAFAIRSKGIDQLIMETNDSVQKKKLLTAKNDVVEAFRILLERLSEKSPLKQPQSSVSAAGTGCPRHDKWCSKLLHAATAAPACDLMCRGGRRDSVTSDVPRLVENIRSATSGLGPAGISDWYNLLRKDINTCCGTLYDGEAQEYTTSVVIPSETLTGPEIALRCSVVLSISGGAAALDCLRDLSLVKGSWSFVEYEDGEYNTKKIEYERTYDHIGPCGRIYIHQCLLHGCIDRVFDELDGPLSDYAIDALAPCTTSYFDRVSPNGAYFGKESCADKIMEIYRIEFPAQAPIPEQLLSRLGKYLESHLPTVPGLRSVKQTWALRFFAAHSDLASPSLLANIVNDTTQSNESRLEALKILKSMIPKGGKASDAAVQVLVAQAWKLINNPSPDPVVLELLAAIPPCAERTSLGLAVVERLAASADPKDPFIHFAAALDQSELRAHLQEVFYSSRLHRGVACALLPLLGPGAKERIDHEIIDEDITTLSTEKDWARRRDKINRLFAACEGREDARQALREHAARRELDYELTKLLKDHAHLYAQRKS